MLEPSTKSSAAGHQWSKTWFKEQKAAISEESPGPCNLLHVAIFAGEISHLHPSVLNKIHSFRKVAETNKLAHHIPQFFIFPNFFPNIPQFFSQIFPNFFPNIPHTFPIYSHHGITSRQRINGRGGFSAALSFPSLVGWAELCSPSEAGDQNYIPLIIYN